MGSSSNVEAAIGGAAYVSGFGVALSGLVLPTDPTTAWPAGMKPLGYVDEKGLTETPTWTTTDVYAWGNVLTRSIISKPKQTFKFVLIESNAQALELYYKNSQVTGVAAPFTLDVAPPGSDIRAFGFDILDGTIHERIVLALAEVSAVGPVVYNSEQAITREVTVTAYVDATGHASHRYSTSAAWGQS